MRASAAAMVVVGLCLAGWSGAARAADAEVEGRKHARKANHLADLNRCKAALPEYDRALSLLTDATLFFNRAECYRRTDQPEKAIADYKQFLIDLPAAPNRAQVEAQIASLEKASAPAPAGAVDGSSSSGALAQPDRPALAPGRSRPAVTVADAPPPILLDSGTSLSPSPGEGEHRSGHAWLWVALGVIVVGAAVGGYLLLTQGKTDSSGGALGNYRF